MIHNVALEDTADLCRIVRFLRGRTVGLVTGGGGAYGPAHLGVHQAFVDRRVEFDIFGGSSVGAAMAAVFAALADINYIQAGVQEIFVRRRALKRITWPRFGLLDHAVFDAELRRFYPGRLENVWKPCFTVAADLTDFTTRILRTGPVWEAIRASAAIPGVLPPFFDEDGHMLVDGGVVDNVPLAAMRALKSGPNVVVGLRSPNSARRKIDYAAIPGRRALLGRTLAPLPGRRALPSCPGPAPVILRTLFANIGLEPRPEGGDIVLRLPAFPGSSFLDWERHREVIDAAYAWTQTRIGHRAR
jgi:NTE family protein